MPEVFSVGKLNNGLRTIIAPVPGTKAVTVLALCKTGSRYETKKINGVSHFLEHMMFKGTTRRPTTLDLSRELDSVGAEYNASTSKDWTGYYVKISHQHIDLAMDVLSDMIWNSKLEEREFNREKGVIIEEIHMYEDSPMLYVENLVEQVMFEGNTLGWDIAGTEPIIRGLAYHDLTSYRDTFYQPQNIVLAAAGNLPKNFQDLAQKYFGQRKPSKKAIPDFKKFQGFTASARPKCKIQYKKTGQVHFAIGFPGFDYDAKELRALQVTNVVLGACMSSRLFIAIRERQGLAYYVRSQPEAYEDTGTFIIRAGLDIGRLSLAVEILKNEINKIRSQGITDKEIDLAREFIRGKLELELEDSASQAEFYSRQMLLMKEVKTPQERLKEITDVTKDDVLKVAKKALDFKKSGLAVIGPFKNKNEVLKYF